MKEDKNNIITWVGKIVDLFPINNADRLESARVWCGAGGEWTGVVPKGLYSIGDSCTVFLQDAIIPTNLGLDFMERSNWRVCMARFRGAPSECLITEIFDVIDGIPIGTPVGNILGVKKYEKPIPAELSGQVKGRFPSFVPKTDEKNYQTARDIVLEMKGKHCYISVKYDGTSCTVYRNRDNFGVCSRNLELKYNDKNSFWNVVTGWGLEETLPDGYAIQFELYGEGIQKNPLGVKGVHGAVFNVYNIKEHRYESIDFVKGLCDELGIPVVDIIAEDFILDDVGDEYLRSIASGTYPNGSPREGIVIRPMTEFITRKGYRASFKVINLDYKD